DRCTVEVTDATSGNMVCSMNIMIKLRDHLTKKVAAVTGRTAWVPTPAFGDKGQNQYSNMERTEAVSAMDQTSMIGDVITEEELAGCTTCRNCEDACPVMNEHVGQIIDMRRY